MQTFKQQPLGKYRVIQPFSFGSTSKVYKIQQKPLLSAIDEQKIQNQTQNDLIFINMNSMKQPQNQVSHNQESNKENKNKFILKLYQLEKIVDKDNKIIETIKYDIFIEFLLLNSLKHPGIVQAKEFVVEYQSQRQDKNAQIQSFNEMENIEKKYISPQTNSNTKKLKKLGIIMQMCQKGSFQNLLNYINRTKVLKDNKLKIIKFYSAQIVNILMYLNINCRVLHRDLKAQNLMVSKYFDIKLIDYGISKIPISYIQSIYNHKQKNQIFQIFNIEQQLTPKQLYYLIQNNQRNRNNMIGSEHYISPQLIEKYRSDIQLIDQAYQKIDIWSFGILLYKIFHNNQYPFSGRNIRQTLQLIYNQNILPKVDQSLQSQIKQIISACLIKDYTKRPSWKQIVKMDFFKNIPIDQIYQVQSPIISLLNEARNKNKQNSQNNIQKVLLDQFISIKYENKFIRKRKLMIIKQKSSQNYKLQLLKQRQSVSAQIQIKNKQSVIVQREQNTLEIKYIQNSTTKQHISILINQNNKQQIDRIVTVLNDEVFIDLQQKISQANKNQASIKQPNQNFPKIIQQIDTHISQLS